METGTVAAAAIALLVGYVVTGFALEHVAYILQYGSLFGPVRKWLEAKACARTSPPSLRWLCGKVRELFACQLCAITQLALWLCAVPLTAIAVRSGGARPFGLTPGLAVWAYVLFGFAVTFSTAAVGVMCWDVARMIGRGTEALVLYLRAKTEAAQAEAQSRKAEAVSSTG